MDKIYISGKIGEEVTPEIEEKFLEAERRLIREFHCCVENPIRIGKEVDEDFKRSGKIPDRADYMKADIIALLSCRAAYFLKDWVSSRGAHAEHRVCTECGIATIYEGTF